MILTSFLRVIRSPGTRPHGHEYFQCLQGITARRLQEWQCPVKRVSRQKFLSCGICVQAYEGLETAKTLREEYVFIPAKVRELYLAHMLETLEEQKLR